MTLEKGILSRPRIFLITTRREIQGLLAGPTLAVSLLERSLAFVTQDDSFDAMPVQKQLPVQVGRGEIPFFAITHRARLKSD